MKTSYNLHVEALPLKHPLIRGARLDFPKHEQQGHSKLFRKTGIHFQGWLLLHKPVEVEIYLKGSEEAKEDSQRFKRDQPRRDVIKRVLKEDPDNHPQRECGFAFTTTFEQAHLELGFIIDEEWLPAFRIHVKSSLEVLEGQGGWLFLDNDTNNSVAQHTGKLRLERKTRKAWANYFKGINNLAADRALKHVVLVAPAKEAVYMDKHPMPRARVTVMEDMLAQTPRNFPLVYPTSELRETKLRSFRVTDTHWSAPGAAEASVLCVSALGLDGNAARELFDEDEYRLKRVNGDLGIKTFPPLSHQERVLTSYRYRKHLIYDNGLPNFGRIMVISNKNAIYDKRCLILGSSSAYSMLAYLSRIFSELTLVHCAGNVDEQLVVGHGPDYLIMQTNARFVVRAPQLGYSLPDDMQNKLKRLTSDEISQLREQAEKYAKATDNTSVKALHSLFETIHI